MERDFLNEDGCLACGPRRSCSVVARNSKMADTKGGLFAKTVKKHAGRAKEKVSEAVRAHDGPVVETQRVVRGCVGGRSGGGGARGLH